VNIHHLELFYHVARHGGISEGVRNMPYGIQQPAMSSQIIQLEQHLGVTLFQRRPFQLTPAGQELFAFIRPFFEQLEGVEEKLRSGGTYEHVRIGGAEIILRDHLPGPLQALKKKFPGLRVTLRSGYLPELEGLLQRKELDFAVTLLEDKLPPGVTGVPLLQLSLGLLVPKASPFRSAEDLWQRDKIDDALICLPLREPITRRFQEGLASRGVEWFAGIEVSSLDVLEAYVLNGYGIGLTVIAPKTTVSSGVRVLALPDFPQVTIGALWQGKPTPILQALLNSLQERAKQLNAR
jgi:DNA-binding transcriptional LysR family regulator